MPTLEHNSLLDRRGRRVGPSRLARGNHYCSIIDAYYAHWGGEYVAETLFDPDDVANDLVDTFVFMQDVPVSLQLQSFWGTSTTPYAANVSNWEERVWVTGSLADNAIMNPESATTEYGRQVIGTTLTHALSVRGYMLATMCHARDLLNAETPLRPSLHLRAWSEGAVMSGWATHAAHDESVLADCVNVTPIILLESDYTIAIQNAGDLFIYPLWGALWISPVVGLYAVREAPPE